MLMDFGEHHRNRHIMQNAFTRDRLTADLDSMTPTIVDAVASWGERGDLRLYPAVKDLGLSIAVKTFMGDEVGKASDLVMTQVNHRLPTIWSDEGRFDPDRFAQGRREDQAHRFAFMPFGGGVHKCIGLYFGGMEIIAVLHRLLLKYEWSLPDDYAMSISWKSRPFPADGLPTTLTRRS